jgi:hypothetical protein
MPIAKWNKLRILFIGALPSTLLKFILELRRRIQYSKASPTNARKFIKNIL